MNSATYIVRQWLKDCWMGTDGEPILDYYENSYWVWMFAAYHKLKTNILNGKLLAYLAQQHNDCTELEIKQIKQILKQEVIRINNLREEAKEIN